MTVLANARIVGPDGIRSGWVATEGAVIAAVGTGAEPPGEPAVDLGGRWLTPGFIDLHVHGGGGAWLGSADPGAIRQAVAFHQRHGTARMLASLVAAPLDRMVAAVAAVAAVVEADGGRHLSGSHLEGPFLAPGHCGALDPASFLPPDPAGLDRLLGAGATPSGRATVRVVTLAPELAGSLELIGRVIGAGAVAAIGHSGAGYSASVEAVERGATLVTHLFNGMGPFHHREPGLVGAGLDRDGVVVELIADGVHVHAPAIRLAFAAKQARGVALVTDAIAAAGRGDGEWQLGGRSVRVSGDRAELMPGGALAGSVLTMDRAVRTAVGAGIALADAVSAATATPARVLGIADRAGSVAPGYDADLVVLDDDLTVAAVMLDGVWLHGCALPALR